jgi:NTP pyrophosphatase (non-canonical NTP hydrolase)
MENYIEKALRTESCDMEAVTQRMTDPKVMRLLHAAQGMMTEAGEFMDMLKKHIWYGKPLDEVNLKEELGDNQWYQGIACDALNTNFDEIQERNIAKLAARYPEKFTEYHAEVRDLEKERTILEGGAL